MLKASLFIAHRSAYAADFLLLTVVAFVCGGLSVLGWAPWALWPIAMICYGVLFEILLRAVSVRRATAFGLAFAVGLHGFGHGWMFTALHDKVGLGYIGAGLSALIFILYNAVFTAVPCAIVAYLWLHRRARIKATFAFEVFIFPICFASVFAFGEYARSLFFNGFTSLSLGFSLIDTWFAGVAPIGGVYLVSWVGFLVASLLVVLIHHAKHRRKVVALLGGVIGIGLYLYGINWVYPMGPPLSFRLLQANVDQQKKFDPQYRVEHTERVAQMIEQNTADIIATPETAFPLFLHQLPVDILTRLQAFSQKTASHLMLGIATIKADSDGYNTILHISPTDGAAGTGATGSISQYRKVHLLAFGEYSPWGFGWFTRNLHFQLKDLEAGPPEQSAFVVGAQRLGILICNEDFVATNARRWIQGTPDATILMNPSNLAWFELTLAVEQHTQIARMRALEVGRPILRVANTGVTAHIDPFGKMLASLPSGKEGVLAGHVQGFTGMTPYGRWGDGWLWVLMLPILLAILFSTSNAAKS